MTKVKLLKTYPREGGLNCLPLLLFGLGIALAIDLQGLLVYNIKQRWRPDRES